MACHLVHISDLHFGRIRDPYIVEALLEDLHALAPAAVVVSGDLTQRARRRQFRQARAFLDRVEVPLLVIPGNHDVPAWYRPWERLRAPLNRYRRYIRPEVHATLRLPDWAIFGLNTAHGRTIKSGYLPEKGIEAMYRFFEDVPPSVVRVLVVHHPPLPLPEIGQPAAIPGGEALLMHVQTLDIRLVLTGHWHHALVRPLPVGSGYLVEAGTALSNRGRGSYRAVNSYFCLTVAGETLSVMERWYYPHLRRFEAFCRRTYPLPPAIRAAGDSALRQAT